MEVMHPAGLEIMSLGYKHIVKIDNRYSGTPPYRKFYNYSANFESNAEIDSDAALTWILLQAPMFSETIHVYKGHQCISCIQHGEHRTDGIYVFFKTLEGALECAKEHGEVF